MYQHAAQARIENSLATTWDQLSNFCITNRYYYSDVPFLAPVGPASYKSNLPARLEAAGTSDANREPKRVLTIRLLSPSKTC